MGVLNLQYSVWKSISQAGNLSTAYQTTIRPNRVHVWSGNNTDLFRAVVDSDDYADWYSAFHGNAIQVNNADEAAAKLIEAASGGAVNNDNQVTVNIDSSDVDGSVYGKDMRYEQQGNVDLPRSNQTPATVYEITEESVFYKILFQLDSDNIYMQVEIDGNDIFPAPHGILFEDLEDLCVGSTVGGGYYGGGSTPNGSNFFGLFQYDSNKWIWEPPRPLYIASNMKIKMKADNSSTSKDYLKGIAIRRTLNV